MQTTKNTGRLLGLLFLATVIAGATGTALRGFPEADANTTDFLIGVIENTGQMKLAIALDILSSAVGVLIALFLFPYIKQYGHRLAMGYTGIAFVNFAIITVSNIIHVTLLSVGSDFDAVGATGSHFTTLASILYDAYYWTHFLILMLYSIGGSVLYYFLFKTQLVPRWLAAWGLLASAIVFTGGALQLADIGVPFWFFIQNGIFILTFTGWLLAMGFSKTRLES
ncbi:DUF4386 domain-containing protein [Spongiimicrobium sp. 3-5]|uniref:DUF4386 domain-containing protein n=1 Tax=Spongiimicrobium sp. 3-5 TaxID=3332596 RepID=UPI00397F8A3B